MRILITGGSSGIGEAAAKKLLEKGHEVIVFDLDEPDLDVEFYQGDVRDEQRVAEVADKEEFDVLVNSAGFYELGAVEDMESEIFEKVFETNVFGPANFIRHSLPMLREHDGRIVNISSVAGKLSMPFYGAYCGSKHALESVSDSLRRESGVEVVIVEPGVVETGFNRRAREALEKYIPESDHSEKYREIIDGGGLDGVPPEKAAETVVKAATDTGPKGRYKVPLRARFLAWMSLLPAFLKDRIFEKIY